MRLSDLSSGQDGEWLGFVVDWSVQSKVDELDTVQGGTQSRLTFWSSAGELLFTFSPFACRATSQQVLGFGPFRFSPLCVSSFCFAAAACSLLALLLFCGPVRWREHATSQSP